MSSIGYILYIIEMRLVTVLIDQYRARVDLLIQSFKIDLEYGRDPAINESISLLSL
jgi:hypothetical protein